MEDRALFALYFSGLVAFQYHPANREHWKEIDLMYFAQLADVMVGFTKERGYGLDSGRDNRERFVS